MDYASTQPLPGDHEAVVIPLGDITIAPPGVSIVRDQSVAFPFTPGEVDDTVLLYDD